MSALNRRHSRGQWITPLADMHDIREAICFVLIWPCIAVIAWLAINPAHFAATLLGFLSWLVA